MVHGGSCGGDRMRNMLISRLPILTWMPRYRRTDLLYDAVSGITVALTLMPQAIAYASLAGLDPLVSDPGRKWPPTVNKPSSTPKKKPDHPIDPNDRNEEEKTPPPIRLRPLSFESFVDRCVKNRPSRQYPAAQDLFPPTS